MNHCWFTNLLVVAMMARYLDGNLTIKLYLGLKNLTLWYKANHEKVEDQSMKRKTVLILSSDPILNTPSFTNLLSTKSLNLTSVLLDDHSPKAKPVETIISLYKQLLDIRSKKSPQKKFIQSSTIISPIVNDKYLPSISIPLVTIDLTSIVPDGKIGNVVIDQQAVWCFCKNGDLFKYTVHIN